MSSIVIMIFFISGILLGFMCGWGAGKERTKSLLAHITNRMQQIRANSKIKAVRRDIAKQYGDAARAEELTNEMAAESTIFYDIRGAINEWCLSNNQKSPVDL